MKKRILVVDDNEDILDMVKEVLTYEDYEVFCIKSTVSFDEHVSKWKPDLIVLDIRLADGDGGELCKKLKSNSLTQHIRVILYSAYISGRKDLASYSAYAFIAKPFERSFWKRSGIF